MLQVLGQLLPLTVALALSSVPITVTMTILLSPVASRSSVFFLIGWLIGMLGVTMAFALGLHAVPLRPSTVSQPIVGIAEIVVGFALIGYGVSRFRRPKPPAPTDPPRTGGGRWLRAVGSIRPFPAFGLGVGLNLRPKSLLLIAAAALIVAPSALTTGEIVIVLLIFVAISASSVAVPVILTLAKPEMMRRSLRAARGWMARNSRTLTAVVVIFVGVVVIGNGLGRL